MDGGNGKRWTIVMALVLTVLLAAAVVALTRTHAARRSDVDLRASTPSDEASSPATLEHVVPVLDEGRPEPRIAVEAAPELAPREPGEPVELVIRLRNQVSCVNDGPVVGLERPPWMIAARIDPSGTVLRAPGPGTYRVSWDSPAWGKGKTTVKLPRKEPLVLDLEPPSLIVARVVDAMTQESLPPYRWSLFGRRTGWKPGDDEVEVQAQNTLDPALCIVAAPAGFAAWRLRIEGERIDTFESELVPVRGLVDLGTIQVVSSRTIIEVSVIDASSGEAVSVAWVRTLPGTTRLDDLVFRQDNHSSKAIDAPGDEGRSEETAYDDRRVSAVVSGSERLEIARSSEPVRLAFWAPRYEPFLSQPMVLQGFEHVEIPLQPGGVVRGQYFPDEAVLRSALTFEANLQSPFMALRSTLEGGLVVPFSFDALLPGTYELSIRAQGADGPENLVAERTVYVRPGEEVEVVLGEHRALPTVRGRVVAPYGEAWQGLWVWSSASEGALTEGNAVVEDGSVSVLCAPKGPTTVVVKGWTTSRRSVYWFGTVDEAESLGSIDTGRTHVVIELDEEADDLPLLRCVQGPMDDPTVLIPTDNSLRRFEVWGPPPGLYEFQLGARPPRRFEVPASGTVTVR